MVVIAFQGEHGAFSEQACHQQFGARAHTVSCRTMEVIDFPSVCHSSFSWLSGYINPLFIRGGRGGARRTPF